MAGWVTLGLMVWRMARRDIYHLSLPLLSRLAAQIMATALMGLALYQAMHLLPPPHVAGHFWALGAWLGAFIIGGALVYGLAVIALGGLRRADIGLLRGSR
jgi:peptidoglycan biosynthesis protein MviN/MurJ (putative lipid II flippase)